MNAGMNSATPSREWRVDEPVRRGFGTAIVGSEPDQRIHLDGLHRNGTAEFRTKRMLLKRKPKACDIVTALGSLDQSHFMRILRRFTGLAPGEYVRTCEVDEVAA